MFKVVITLALTLFLSQNSQAKDFGLGVILGSPTGVSGKLFMRQNTAIDAALSYSGHEVIFYADYLRHFPGAFGKQNAFLSALSPYVGIGPVLALGDGDKDHNKRYLDDDEDSFALGGRIPFGIEWIAREVPIGVSLEIAPGMTVITGTNAFAQGGLALRYYFD